MREKTNNRPNRKLFLFFGLVVVIACKLLPQSQPTPIPTTFYTTPVARNQLPTKTPTLSFSPPIFAPPTQLVDFVPSENAGEYVGEVVIVRIEKAYCSYRPDVNGAPTFCNDQPFPNHTFTLIAWGKDWTDLDSKCVYITGEVKEYQGKYEIIADSRDQVSLCD
jgi:hypothetical protein